MNIQQLYQQFLKSAGVSTDTRTILPGQLFFALKGPAFDGNKYASKAMAKGARMAIIDRDEYALDRHYIVVPDALIALQELAKEHRKHLEIPVFGLTGSNGKTTTKELMVTILQSRFKVAATSGNYNNHIGVPLTILNTDSQAEILIVEMGSNQPGDIRELCVIADPDFGLITNIGTSHLEKLISIEGVLNEKQALYDHIKNRKGCFFLNIGDAVLKRLPQDSDRIITYNQSEGIYGTICISDHRDQRKLTVIWEGIQGTIEIPTHLTGNYNIENISAALSVGTFFDLEMTEMAKSISAYQPNNMRSQLTRTERNSIILDTYNANPSSMTLSILSALSQNPEKVYFILGEMLELGSSAQKKHGEIVELLKEHDVVNALLIGQNFADLNQDNFPVFTDSQHLIDSGILEAISDYDVFVKGSRGVKLELLLPFL